MVLLIVDVGSRVNSNRLSAVLAEYGRGRGSPIDDTSAARLDQRARGSILAMRLSGSRP
jgi:hypothetical protein